MVAVHAPVRPTVASDLTWQASLFGSSEPSFDASFAGVQRRWLDDFTWIDHQPNWLSGADTLYTALAEGIAWRQREVTMWGNLVAEPRLTAWFSDVAHGDLPEPVLGEIRDALTAHYRRSFDSVGCNLYRDGRDSVAWHSDRERYTHEQPIVVIVSLGSQRRFMLRPRGGGASISYCIGHGDLLVMGGACQHDWEHCVPKMAAAPGPRLSVMFRHDLSEFDPDS